MAKITKIVAVIIFSISALLCFRPVIASNLQGVDLTASVSSAVGAVGNFFNFFSQTVFGKIKSDFCGNYRASISSNEWKSGEFRTSLGEKICPSAGTSVSNTAQSKKTTAQTSLAKNTTTPSANVNTPSITDKAVPNKNAETPGPLLGNTTPDGTDLNQTQIIYWTNIERVNTTLPALSENTTLDSIAMARVNDMFEKEYFEHVSPTGDNVSKMSDRFDYQYIYIGENIAMGNFGSSRDLLNAWMASPGHRENILNTNYTEIGVAAKEARYNGDLVWISAQVFGKPLSSCPSPDANKKIEINTDYATSNAMQTQANSLLAEIKTINPTSNPATYNSKVAEYNNLADSINILINKTKKLITEYNSSVTVFNTCIKK